jgi:hypothetical protein
MPPAQALVASRPFSNVRQPALNLTYVALSLSFVFISGMFLAYCSIVRRHRPIHESARHNNFTNLDSSANKAKKRASFSPTVSALVTQSTIVASSPLRLKIIPSFRYPSTAAPSVGHFHHGFRRLLLASTISRIASSSVASSKSSRNRATAPLLSTLHPLRATRIIKLFPGLRRQTTSSDVMQDAGSHGHPSDQMDPVVDKDGLEPDTRVPDTVNSPQILRSIDDADSKCKSEIPVIPFIILSLPSNEPLTEDPSQPCSPDEDLLSPEGTFRSTRLLARVEADTHDISDATRLALAYRLGERRKRPMLLPPLNILGTPSMAWPRWF